jgi:tRNA (guanine37-N1)-methyltransferase
MRIDVVSIFPDYLAPLGLSLAGRARERGLLSVQVHDLRDWTHDRHRTVDDTPYGGGAGMVMRPEPWGEVLDAVLTPGATLVVPTPGGVAFTQQVARELAGREHLVFACGRYEGIDQRVADHYATSHDVRELSIGDYVLTGGEVAALVVVEAVARLLPGFMGNAESLLEESHEAGLLEHPSHTKPASWRGHDVPAVLLSGEHAAIAAWRHQQSLARTAQRRPDLLPASALPGGEQLRPAVPADSGEILTLQRACWMQEQHANPEVWVPALHESVDDVRRWLPEWTVLTLRRSGRLVAAARARLEGDVWDVGRVMVAPDLQGQGLGRLMLEAVEDAAPDGTTTYSLFTGAGSVDNQRFYRRAGYRLRGKDPDVPGAVRLTKRISH